MTFVFWLSKVFYIFLSPFNWIIGLLIWRYICTSNRLRRRLGIAAVIIFLVFSNEYIYSTACLAWQPSPVELKPHVYNTGIVLGGLTSVDKNSRSYFRGAADRFIQANKLYHQDAIEKIIVSGGWVNSEKEKEANFIRSQLIASGTPANDIIVEDKSRNTYENALFTKIIIDSLKLQGPFVLITSALHMPRASSIFKKAGVQVIGYPCNYMVIEKEFNFLDYVWPDVDVLMQWQTFLKEVVGLTIYKLTGKA